MGQYFIFFILALLAEIVGTISGFGSSILFVPLASLLLDFKIVLGITAVFHVFSNISKIFLFKKGIDKQIALKLGIPAVLFVTLGAWLTNYIPQKEIDSIFNATWSAGAFEKAGITSSDIQTAKRQGILVPTANGLQFVKEKCQ